MIQFILATLLANPCLAPHVHKHHTVTPVQSCVVPAVPMCFRDASDPDIAPAPGVYPYYITTPVSDDGTQGEGPYLENTEANYIGPIGGYVPPSPHIVQTPEISAVGTIPAVVLLLGAIAVLGGRRV